MGSIMLVVVPVVPPTVGGTTTSRGIRAYITTTMEETEGIPEATTTMGIPAAGTGGTKTMEPAQVGTRTRGIWRI